jgi:hypothetical protein
MSEILGAHEHGQPHYRVFSVPAKELRRGLAGIAVLASAALIGCASGSPQTAAARFRGEHAAVAAHVIAGTKMVESELAGLPLSPTRLQLTRLEQAAREAHGELVKASGWDVAGRGEEGAEEEDVPRAETQVTEGAGEMAAAMSALQTYAHAPSAATLAGYKSKLADGQTQWDEGISELWHLANAPDPPTL